MLPLAVQLCWVQRGARGHRGDDTTDKSQAGEQLLQESHSAWSCLEQPCCSPATLEEAEDPLTWLLVRNCTQHAVLSRSGQGSVAVVSAYSLQAILCTGTCPFGNSTVASCKSAGCHSSAWAESYLVACSSLTVLSALKEHQNTPFFEVVISGTYLVELWYLLCAGWALFLQHCKA